MTDFIPRCFFRVWVGPRPIPSMFEGWWQELKQLHPDFEMLTLGEDAADTLLDPMQRAAFDDQSNRSSQSDILRYAALYKLGGVFIDIDVLPLRSFDPLLSVPGPFAPMRSSKSLANSVIGSPEGHPAAKALYDGLPDFWMNSEHPKNLTRKANPYFNSVWLGREDVRHLPMIQFYPDGQKWEWGRGPEKQVAKDLAFSKRDFPPETVGVHYSAMTWGALSKEGSLEETADGN